MSADVTLQMIPLGERIATKLAVLFSKALANAHSASCLTIIANVSGSASMAGKQKQEERMREGGAVPH